jgi:site-specific DNA recombinase
MYLRLSAKSKGQRNLVNIETQEADCRKLADDLGAMVVRTFVEYGESAFDRDDPDDRPQYAGMCDAMMRGEIDVVLAWHTDRLWRDDLEKALFVRDAQRAGLQLVVTKTAKIDPHNADDEFLLTILTAVAKKESADKRRRVRSKMQANAAAGKVSGGKYRPFAYADDKVTIIESEAAIVREICARLLRGETLRAVTAWANSTGTPTPLGKAWTPSRIRDMAVSYRYCGTRAVGRGMHARIANDTAEWPSIVDRQTIDKLRALLLDPARRTNRSARKYLLSGHVRCWRCGEPMMARPRTRNRDENGLASRTYACLGDPGRSGCGRCSIIAEPLETLVEGTLLLRFEELAAAGAFKMKANPVNDGISAELAEIDAKSRALGTLFADGKITEAAFEAGSAGLVARRARLSAQVRRDVSALPTILAEFAADPTRLRAMWDTPSFTFDRKRAFVVALLDSVTIGPHLPGQRQFQAARVLDVKWNIIAA